LTTWSAFIVNYISFGPHLSSYIVKKNLGYMNIINNRMRNRMSDDQLNVCLVIYIVKDIFIDI